MSLKPDTMTFVGSDYNHKILRVCGGGQNHSSPTAEAMQVLNHRTWGLSRISWVENGKRGTISKVLACVGGRLH